MVQRWEYKVLRVYRGTEGTSVRDSEKGKWTLNQREIQKLDQADFCARVLNEMGKEGWELVSRNAFDYVLSHYVFKRPVSE